jgi:hypothetical protein
MTIVLPAPTHSQDLRDQRKGGVHRVRRLDASGWTFVIDGSNFAHSRDGSANLAHLLRVVLALRTQFVGLKPVVYFDASLRFKLPASQRNAYERLIESTSPTFFECLPGKTADEYVLRYASNHPQAIAVSNDRFRDLPERKWRLGVLLLRVPVYETVVVPAATVDVYADPERPRHRHRLPLNRILQPAA